MGQEDDISQFASLLAKVKQSPLVVVFIVGLFAGGSGANILNIIEPPRVDPYTGTMGAAEREARIAGDAALARAFETERKERERAHYELSEKLRLLEEKIDRLVSAVTDHNRQAERYIEKIDQLEKKSQR